MERLTYRGTPQMTEDGMVTPSYCDYPVRRIIERLADYEDAEEQGLLKMLPCCAGDTVYLLWKGKIYERKVNGFSITSNNRLVVHFPDCDMDNATLSVEQFGKILFLSREAALAEKGGAECVK